MSPDERNLIQGLFDRLRQVDGQQRDPEAERLIADNVRVQPGAPYFMSQAIIVQEQALQAAQGRIEELEQRVQQLEAGGQQATKGGFLSSVTGGLFGANKTPAAYAPTSVPPAGARYASQTPVAPYAAQPMAPQMGQMPPQQMQPQQMQQGGGFLKNAMATAAGVAGGALLFQGISSMFGGQHNTASNPWGANPAHASQTGSGGGMANDDGRYQEAEQGLLDDADTVDYGGGDDSMDL